MWTLAFSSCKRFPIVGIDISSGLVGKANSLALVLFESVARYCNKSLFKVEFEVFKVSNMIRDSSREKESDSRKLPYFSENQSPKRLVTNTPFTRRGAVNVSPSGRLPQRPLS